MKNQKGGTKMKINRIINQKRIGGITLIALVITIIVLLILAGISIIMLTGDNSILKRAADAKERTGTAEREEQRRLTMLEAASNIEETSYNGVTIPAGCAPTKLQGESTVDEGLVIIDSKGNEFVWIEVPKTKTASATTDDEIYSALRDYCNDVIIKNGGTYKTGTMRFM